MKTIMMTMMKVDDDDSYDDDGYGDGVSDDDEIAKIIKSGL